MIHNLRAYTSTDHRINSLTQDSTVSNLSSNNLFIENADLTWDLTNIKQQQSAVKFIKQFECTFCVYSSSVEQLYATYNIYLPKDQARKLVILPDPNAYYDTLNNISENAITTTGIYIIPGEMINQKGILLTNLTSDKKLGNKQIPFEQGIRKVMNSFPKNEPFLPVISKGDLREFNASWPVIHLHRIKLHELTTISELEISEMKKVILKKLENFIKNLKKNT